MGRLIELYVAPDGSEGITTDIDQCPDRDTVRGIMYADRSDYAVLSPNEFKWQPQSWVKEVGDKRGWVVYSTLRIFRIGAPDELVLVLAMTCDPSSQADLIALARLRLAEYRARPATTS